MKTKILWMLLPILALGAFFAVSESNDTYSETARLLNPSDGCVFMTVMGEQSSEEFNMYKSDENLMLSVRDGLSWLAEAQLPNGGYGAGSHSAQHVRDPHAVKADPATTAMVAQAFLRSGTTIKSGKYAKNLKDAIDFLLETVESAPKKSAFITDVRGTQIQTKLGENIDAVLTAQLLSNLLDRNLKGIDKKRVERCLDICVGKIEAGTDATGRQSGAGWAGVLQSGLATSALEAAQVVGADVDEEVVERSKNYQKDNYDEKTGNVKTDDGAGIMLYAVSGSVRSSAKEARKAEAAINKAKKEGKLDKNAPVSAENLRKAGYSESEAMGYATSYNVYQSAKKTAQREDVLNGFGNNGGEEFLSFLQTGESLLVNRDKEWKDWYDDMSGRILKIQNQDGSWNGHHCITSPVFCTATSLLLLTVENDIDFLSKVGE
ncbi:MAG: hypothetical protein KJO05_07115 [Bacteroidia bacterium]|nr:hypothetical protein [Bacteroidia bacterium]NNF32363.1 hypothetical protein [Flavobacteriaceae bacterium]MBT8276347.1 hypothetical protein [Bacteroidia bacterium]NNJ81408.1 hypothetical protein [Flavobacteriaceae bacterium]NNK53239.1 hypothetical protein [Flavobacteriaceae bacterium]